MHELIVLSDLHLGRGLDLESGHYHRLETFFYDDDFKRFCQHLCDDALVRGAALRMVFNGDVFDFLRIDPEEPRPDARARERRFGPTLTPSNAARMAAHILEGHPAFVEGLALFLAAGHEVVILPGNHDVEMQWAQVQAEVRKALESFLKTRRGEEVAQAAVRRLTFLPWFYYEPGRIWIEHGCQYDPENAFRYPLRGGLDTLPDDVFYAEQDFPLGNFFQRYLYNAFGNITFIVPSTRANFRYAKWLLLNEPRLLIRVVASHVPFALQLLRRMARKAGGPRPELARAHEVELADLAKRSGLGERLQEIEGFKFVGAEVVQAAGELLRQLIKLSVSAILITLVGSALWALGSQFITELKVGLAPKALMSVAFNFVLMTLIVIGLGFALIRVPKDKTRWPLRRAARKIVGVLDVPLITFGHTHDEVIGRIDRPSGGRAWYFNTGTWIAVFTHDVLLPRERVQFTFLRVRGHKGELLHWSPGRGEPMRVVLLDDRGPPEAATHPIDAVSTDAPG